MDSNSSMTVVSQEGQCGLYSGQAKVAVEFGTLIVAEQLSSRHGERGATRGVKIVDLPADLAVVRRIEARHLLRTGGEVRVIRHRRGSPHEQNGQPVRVWRAARLQNPFGAAGTSGARGARGARGAQGGGSALGRWRVGPSGGRALAADVTRAGGGGPSAAGDDTVRAAPAVGARLGKVAAADGGARTALQRRRRNGGGGGAQHGGEEERE